jgi:hypothetical protein
MCTVTWLFTNGGYELFCNRDEKLTRKPAKPPRLVITDGIRTLAPADGDFGGAWIGTNEFGVSLCLLNGVSGPDTIASRSRGLLLMDLLPRRSNAEIRAALEDVDLSPYAPFTLAALEPSGPALVMEWDGKARTLALREEPQGMLTSSSFDTAEVKKRRLEQFRRLRVADASELREFHRSHETGASAYTVCMHRPDAQTVSFSHIRVTQEESGFEYLPAAPCKVLSGIRQSLALRAS